MNLGPHAFFILAAYAATGLVVALLILRAIVDHRAQVKALAELESRGARRRSADSSSSGDTVAPSPAAGRAGGMSL
jgi:heme exporter protein D